MRIDCSKISNKTDILVFVLMALIVSVICLAISLAYFVDSFIAGFFSATCLLKWHDWIYKPADKALDKLWSEKGN